MTASVNRQLILNSNPIRSDCSESDSYHGYHAKCDEVMTEVTFDQATLLTAKHLHRLHDCTPCSISEECFQEIEREAALSGSASSGFDAGVATIGIKYGMPEHVICCATCSF